MQQHEGSCFVSETDCSSCLPKVLEFKYRQKLMWYELGKSDRQRARGSDCLWVLERYGKVKLTGFLNWENDFALGLKIPGSTWYSVKGIVSLKVDSRLRVQASCWRKTFLPIILQENLEIIMLLESSIGDQEYLAFIPLPPSPAKAKNCKAANSIQRVSYDALWHFLAD